jgi:CRISPR-associated endoribonuclease Cas6
MCVLSIIKDCLRRGDEAVYQRYYSSPKPKPFTFSVFLRDFRMDTHEMTLSGFDLNVSSSDYEFMIPLMNGLQRTERFQYKGYTISRGLIRYGRDPNVLASRIVVRTNSPILVEDGHGRPLAPTDPTYSRELNHIASRLSLTLRGEPLRRELRIRPIAVKKTVVKERNEDFDQALAAGKVSGDFLYFTAYRGTFELEGDPYDLLWLLGNGVGLRTAQGFGHVRLEREVTT